MKILTPQVRWVWIKGLASLICAIWESLTEVHPQITQITQITQIAQMKKQIEEGDAALYGPLLESLKSADEFFCFSDLRQLRNLRIDHLFHS